MEEIRKHQDFHVGLKAFIADGDKLLVLQDEAGLWELHGGRIEQSEIANGLEKILRRETGEELSAQFEYEVGTIFHAWVRKPDPLTDIKLQYKNKDFYIFLVGFRCVYKGGEITLSPEHIDSRWIAEDEVDALKFENTYKETVQKYFQTY